MAADGENKSKTAKGKTISQEEIHNGFQALRNEQRALIAKLSELEMDLSEHKIVVSTLEDMDGDRRCFRMVGGVLCERTVKDVLPQLVNNRDSIIKVVEHYNELVVEKGKEINEYKEKYNIRVRGHEDIPTSEGDAKEKGTSASQSKNVMVEAM